MGITFLPPNPPCPLLFHPQQHSGFSFLLPIKWSQVPMPSIQDTPSPAGSSNMYLPSYFTLYPTPLTLSLWLNISHPLFPIEVAGSFIYSPNIYWMPVTYHLFSKLSLSNCCVLGLILEPVNREIGKGIMLVNGKRPWDIFGDSV